MTWAQTLQELRIMKFKRIYTGWQTKKLTQEQAADLLGVSARTFRRYIDRYTEDGLSLGRGDTGIIPAGFARHAGQTKRGGFKNHPFLMNNVKLIVNN